MNKQPEDSGASDVEKTSSSLVAGIQASDPEAWEQFWEQYGPKIYLWARHRGLSIDDAQDVAQDVAAKVNMSVEAFSKRDHVGSFRKWLRTVTTNTAIDFQRRTARQPDAFGGSEANQQLQNLPFDNSVVSQSLDGSSEVSVNSQRIEQVKKEVKETTWKAFWLREMEDKSTAEVAQELGMTERAVRLACFRIKNRLRDKFQDESDKDRDK